MSGTKQEPHFADVRVGALSAAQITIVGLGLMGASLAGALLGRCRAVIGVARRQETVQQAMELGLVDRATTSLQDGVSCADIVVLATPVRVILDQVSEIGPLLPEGCLLMDMGSTKDAIVATMADLPPHVQPLGGHPMCGKETSGIEVADVALYRDRTFILSPLPRTSRAALALGHALVEAVGAKPLVIEAARQDYLVGTVSHLPYLLACALVGTADATTSADPLAWQIVAGGFRDTSRVAGSSVAMMVDILLTNQQEVAKATQVCMAQLQRLADLVAEGDEDTLRTTLSVIRDKRKEMFP